MGPFNSPAGKYKFRRLPFGLCVSQDIFQKYMDEIIEKAGVGVDVIANDIVVHGKDELKHDDALQRLMKVAKKYGLVFRFEKCEIKKQMIEFYGLVWSKNGMKPVVKKCDDIRNRPASQNRQELPILVFAYKVFNAQSIVLIVFAQYHTNKIFSSLLSSITDQHKICDIYVFIGKILHLCRFFVIII